MYQPNTSTPNNYLNIAIIDESKVPTIAVTPSAMAQMQAYVDLCPQEISWMGHVSQIENTYVIDAAHLLEQEVAPATCSLTESGLNHFMVTTIQEKGVDYYDGICVWGHSHVNMSASPSGQDNKQVLEWRERDYFIMLILNKKGDVHCDFYDFKNNIAYKNLPVQMFVPELKQIHQQAQQDIKKYIRESKPMYTYSGYAIAEKQKSKQYVDYNEQVSMKLDPSGDDLPLLRSYLLEYLLEGHDTEDLIDTAEAYFYEAQNDVHFRNDPYICEDFVSELPATSSCPLDDDVYREKLIKELSKSENWVDSASSCVNGFIEASQYIDNFESVGLNLARQVGLRMTPEQRKKFASAPRIDSLIAEIMKQGAGFGFTAADAHALRHSMTRIESNTILKESEVATLFTCLIQSGGEA